MDESAAALEVFLQLPDFEQEMASQALGKVLEEFPQFPELLLEVRRMIWRATMPPGRMVPLLPIKFCKSPKHSESCCCIPKLIDLPVALFVNRESRIETLKLYRVIHRDPQWAESLNGIPQPLCLRPDTDVPWVRTAELMNGLQSLWLAPMISQNPGCFDHCKVLEIRDFGWFPLQIGYSVYTDIPYVLAHFPALEEIRIRLFEFYSAHLFGSRARPFLGGRRFDFTEQDRIDSETLFKKHFLEQKRNDPKFKAPKVTILEWKKLQGE